MDATQPPKRKTAAHPLETRDRAKALFLAGEKPENICRELGINSSLIHTWAYRGKWIPMRQRVIDKTTDRIAATIQSVRDKEIEAHIARIDGLTASKLDTLGRFTPKNGRQLLDEARALKVLDDVQRRNLGLDDSGGPARQTINLNLGTTDPKPVVDVG